MNDTIIDIETFCYDSPVLKEKINDIKAPGNWKDPEKIKRYKLEKKEEIEKKAALSPLTGRIVVASIAIDKTQQGELLSQWDFKFLIAKSIDDEPELIRQVDNILYSYNPMPLITFNGRLFDIPFIITRAAINNISLQHKLPIKKYDKNHIDLIDVLKDGKLDYYLKAFGLPGKDGSGADVHSLVTAGDWAGLTRYCQDIRQVVEVWKRVKNAVRY